MVQFTNFLKRSLKNSPISGTGYQFKGEFWKEVSILGQFVLEQGAKFESRAAPTHPKNTQVPPGRLRKCNLVTVVACLFI